MAILSVGFNLSEAYALNGSQSLGLTTFGGWQKIELLSQGDNLSGISDPGYGSTATRGIYDGLGLYRQGNNLSVWVNHETSSAAISRVDIDLPELKNTIDNVINSTAIAVAPVVGVGYAYNTIFDGSYNAQLNANPVATGVTQVASYGNLNFARFCSGTSHHASDFGSDRGFVDSIYLTGEEVTGGKFYALDEANQSLWEVPDLGFGNWENAAAVDTKETGHVALVLSSDVGSFPGDYLRMYVGRKGIDSNNDGEIDFLERNGLRGGEIHYFKPGSGSTTDLPDGSVDGLWSTNTAGALQETKLEDIHTNPFDGNQLVLADQTDGVYRMNVNLNFLPGGGLDLANSPVSIFQIDDDDVSPVGSPDNLTWSRDGNLYVQEDGDGNGIFRMNPLGGDLTQIAVAGSEPSGIIDISEQVGYLPGSVLLTSLQGSGGTGAQLGALISPDATALAPGDYDLDGDVDSEDYMVWQSEFGSTSFSFADGNGDGQVDAADYTLWRDQADAASIAVPEPTTGLALLLSGLLWSRRLNSCIR